MYKRKVFVSFDYDKDKRYKFLLQAWSENSQFQFVFDDTSSAEINTNNVGRVKAGLTTKIKESTHVLVIVGSQEYQNISDQTKRKVKSPFDEL
jgi:hypothetical protein